MVKFTKSRYEVIPLETFSESLQSFHRKDREKIKGKIEEMLCENPYRYPMLAGKIKIKGINVEGLRRMKVGVKGVKGGAYILYRICEECKQNKYELKSDVRCKFCDDTKVKHVVLFITRLRSFGY